MDNGEVKRFRPRPVKAPQGGEENVLKGVFSQNLRWLRLEDYHRLYIPVLKIGRQWRIPTAGCALSNLKKQTFFNLFFHPPLKRSRPSKGPPYGRAEDCVFFFLKRCTDVSTGDSLFVDQSSKRSLSSSSRCRTDGLIQPTGPQ